VIDGFMAQTGDPTGTGQGGSELPDLKAEFNPMPHVRGTVSMARAQIRRQRQQPVLHRVLSALRARPELHRFGRVISGHGRVDAIERGEPPANPTRILQASIAPTASRRMPRPAPGFRDADHADMLNASPSRRAGTRAEPLLNARGVGRRA
jgi:cyclophilin family peptidyl-prolyl cis-trans isomerase